jgi:hypothetical protein
MTETQTPNTDNAEIISITTSREYVDQLGTEHVSELPEGYELIDYVDSSTIEPGDCWTARIGARGKGKGEFVLVGKTNVKALKAALRKSLNCTDDDLNFATLKKSLERIQAAMDRFSQKQEAAAAFWNKQDLGKPSCSVYTPLETASEASLHPELLILNHLANGSDDVSEGFVKMFGAGMTRLHQTRDEMLGKKAGGDTFAYRSNHLPWLTEEVLPQFEEDCPKSDRPWSRYQVWLVTIGDRRQVIVARSAEFRPIMSAMKRAWENAKERRAKGNKKAIFRYTFVTLPVAVLELQFQNKCYKKVQAEELEAAGGAEAISPLVQKLGDDPRIQALQAKMQAEAEAQVDPTRKGKGRRPKGKHSHA